MSHYETNLDKNKANYVPLTPISFLERAKDIYPNYEALVYETKSFTWTEVFNRCIKFASALEKIGITEGDTVSVMTFNTPEIFEAHYSVPMTGAILNTINSRLDAKTVAYILEHSEAKVLIIDRQLHAIAEKALSSLKQKPIVIDVQDDFADQTSLKKIGDREYEEFLNTGDENFIWKKPKDEWQAISLSYTSGTTGNPKGVVYHHRGSYLMSTGSAVAWNMPNRLNFLTVVPMFHCNGWGYPWTAALIHAKVVCCRYIVAKDIYNLIDQHKVTHFGGAPIVLSLIANADEKDKKVINHKVFVLTAGAPPTSAILEKMDNLGFEVMHVYGLTETYGHILQCAWNEEWNELPKTEKADINSRQGVRYPNTEEVIVADPESHKRVPMDGKTMGEILIRGNVVMKGYYKNKEATETSMKNGWFHSGDLAVVYPDGYIQIKDRSKDIIISGGENISSVEVENVVAKHDSVSLVAVVAKPDEKWGETPCAFVELAPGKNATEEEIIQFCKENMAGFKRPKHVIFGELPKTSTGKIQKFELRTKAKEL